MMGLPSAIIETHASSRALINTKNGSGSPAAFALGRVAAAEPPSPRNDANSAPDVDADWSGAGGLATTSAFIPSVCVPNRGAASPTCGATGFADDIVGGAWSARLTCPAVKSPKAMKKNALTKAHQGSSIAAATL